MYIEILLFLGGLAALLYGAEKTVDAATGLAKYYGLSAFFIGVTVISIGTSIPEMATSLVSSFYGHGDIVVGNIVGSETAQITLAVGIVALIAPIIAHRKHVLVYGGGMLTAMVIMILVLEDGAIIRSEGFLMMFTYMFFIYHMYTTEDGAEIVEGVDGEATPPVKAAPWIIVGLTLVVGGTHFMVENGVALAHVFNVPEYIIGLLTGLGTTLPEIAIAGLAAWSGRHGISGGSLFGSNITDPVFSLGIGAFAASEITVTSTASVLASALYMLAVSTFVVALFYWQEGIDRRTAWICILLYLPAFFTDQLVAAVTTLF